MNISNENKRLDFAGKIDANKVPKKESLVIPVIAAVSSVISAGGYLLGSAGLYYDTYNKSNGSIKRIFLPEKEPENYNSQSVETHEGVKTITPDSKFAKIGLNGGRVGVAASSLSGITAGLATGNPMMTMGEVIGLTGAPIIETPIGTGLFGIGIATIFSSLAIENTPELMLNKKLLREKKSLFAKAGVILKNMQSVVKEVCISCATLAKNASFLVVPGKHSKAVKFFKDNIFSSNPKSIVFQELVDKNGKVFIGNKMNMPKNYLLHSASAILGLGGAGVVLFSLLDNKKAQKKSFVVEEAGFLADNVGMTKFGADKLSLARSFTDTAGGVGYTIGGVINAASQFMGLDNKQGRAAQWLGIGLVFAGFGVDRFRHLKNIIKNNKAPKMLMRQWQVNFEEFFNLKNAKEEKLFKTTVCAVKKGDKLPGSEFKNVYNAFNSLDETNYIEENSKISELLGTKLSQESTDKIRLLKTE